MKLRRRKREQYVKRTKWALRFGALLMASWWGWRTAPELVRYIRMERM